MFATRILATHVAVAMLLCASPARASGISGSWLIDQPGFTATVAFLADGRYVEAAILPGDPGHTGLEWGTYSWDAASNALSATALGDLNGNWGVAGDAHGPRSIALTGNTAIATQAGCAACTYSLHRILPGAAAIVGSWLQSDPVNGITDTTTFLADGRYIEASVVAGDAAHSGIEWGTYSWNAASGAIAAVAKGDTNGNWGLAGDVDGAIFITVNGNSATAFQPGCADCSVTLDRILGVSAVPEANTTAMLALGLGVLGWRARRRNGKR